VIAQSYASPTSTVLTVTGPPGSLKTTLIRHALADYDPPPPMLHLNGLLHSTPSSLAFGLSGAHNVGLGRAMSGLSERMRLTCGKAEGDAPLVIYLTYLHLFTSHSPTLLYTLTDSLHSTSLKFLLLLETPVLSTQDMFERRVRSRMQAGTVVTVVPPSLSDALDAMSGRLSGWGGLSAAEWKDHLEDPGGVGDGVRNMWNLDPSFHTFSSFLRAGLALTKGLADPRGVKEWKIALACAGYPYDDVVAGLPPFVSGLSVPQAVALASCLRIKGRQDASDDYERRVTEREVVKESRTMGRNAPSAKATAQGFRYLVRVGVLQVR